MIKPDLPSCCELVAGDNEFGLTGIDFWIALPSGDDFTDREWGDRYAAEVIRHARETGQPLFVDCVIMSMTMGLSERYGAVKRDKLEQSFPLIRSDAMTHWGLIGS